jgi:hydrogenase 3 maturation protease
MKYLIMCIGNRTNGGDDALGPYVSDKLKKEFTVIDCNTNPENYTSFVKKHNPEKLIIIDAIDMGLEPGSLRIVPKEKIGVFHISTHGIPLSVLIKYLDNFVKKIVLIGIQPKKMSGKMTAIVKKNANELVEFIKSDDINKIKRF